MDQPGSESSWDWSVPLDEAFIQAAPVREPPGHARAARARRIDSGHRRSEVWRGSVVPAASRQWFSRWRQAGVGGLIIASMTAFVIVGAGRAPGHQGMVGRPGDGTPQVPDPADARQARLLPPTLAPAGDGGYALFAEDRGRAIGFDPCRPVHWVLRERNAPPDAAALLMQAFSALSHATGLVFVFDGPTDEGYNEDRALVDKPRYGNRYVPVLVTWSDASETQALAGRPAGVSPGRLPPTRTAPGPGGSPARSCWTRHSFSAWPANVRR